MFMRNARTLCLAVGMAGVGPVLVSQAAKVPANPTKPVQVQPRQPLVVKGLSKLEIKTISTECSGFDITWLASIENKGTAPSTGNESLTYFRVSSDNTLIPANVVPVAAIAPGSTVVHRVPLNPDPAVNSYLFKIMSQSKDIHMKSYGLGLPSVSVALHQVKEASGDRWAVKVLNTFGYLPLRFLKLQVFKKQTASSNWERVEDKGIGPMAPNAAVEATGSWDSGISQYKAVVLMQRIPNEPWKELASQTVTITP